MGANRITVCEFLILHATYTRNTRQIHQQCTRPHSSTASSEVNPVSGDSRQEAAMSVKLIRIEEVQKRVPLSRATLWRKERAGTFPRRIKLSSNAVGWDE